MKFINTYTGSFPVVLHAPGQSRFHPLWERIVKATENHSPVSVTEDVEIVTWSSYDTPTLLENVCKQMSIPLTVLRPDTGVEWYNMLKPELLIKHLKTSKAKYIIGLDADDVVLLDGPDEIVRRFKGLYENTKILFNAAKVRWPRKFCPPLKECDAFERTFTARCKHLNAGAFIGEREILIDFYKKVMDVERDKIFHTAYRKMEQPSVRMAAFPLNYPVVDIDRDCAIFQHMLSGVDDLESVDDYPKDKDLIYYDLGGFIGQTTANFIAAHNPAKATAFEPNPASIKGRHWNYVRRNGGKVINSAVGAKDGTVDFYMDSSKSVSQSCTAAKDKVSDINDQTPVPVDVIDFSNYIATRHRINQHTVVKMDVEGGEYEILSRMMKTGSLRNVDELRIEWHSHKMSGNKDFYTVVEEGTRLYCMTHNINLVEMDH
jgi:FkbM family methyltransferase